MGGCGWVCIPSAVWLTVDYDRHDSSIFFNTTHSCFDSCPCLSPGEPSLRKRSTEGALQDQPPVKRVDGCALTGSEGTVEALTVSSPAPVESRGAVAAERSPLVCKGELCGVSFSSMRLGCNRPCLCAVLGVLCGVMWFV